MKLTVDLNCDMGESFGAYQLGLDREVIKYVTSANIACGFHASDPTVMKKTVGLCKTHRVMAGAHPGYPDLLGFGRRSMDCSEEEIMDYVIYQVGALKGFLDYYGLELQHIKLHGALYNRLVNEEQLFLRICREAKKAFGDLIFLTLGTRKTTELKRITRAEGIRMALEAFPDRMYTDDGELLSRKHKEAVIKDNDLIARRAVKMVLERGIESVNGSWIDMDIDTLCIHGDNMESVEAAVKIHAYAQKEGITLRPLGSFYK
ncbi:MAG: 5-oxoprolinase subunit PxpA [Thermoguttaceae bacterium]